MWAQILCYKNQGIHWYHCNPTFLWKNQLHVGTKADLSFNLRHFWPIWNRSDGRDYREKRIIISRFLAPYIYFGSQMPKVSNMCALKLTCSKRASNKEIQIFGTQMCFNTWLKYAFKVRFENSERSPCFFFSIALKLVKYVF